MSTKISAVENSMANQRAVSYTHLDVYKRQATYLRQFEAAACANNWAEKDKTVLLVLSLKGPCGRTGSHSSLWQNYNRKCHLTAKTPVPN